MSFKTCSRCHVELALSEFGKKGAGLQSKCRACCRAACAEWYAANRDEENRKKRARYEANRPRALEQQKAYYQANRDARIAYIKDWRAQHPEYAARWYEQNAARERERAKRWKELNPDRARAQEKARRARTRHLPPWADTGAMAELYRKAKGLRELGVDCHVDHVVPLRGKLVSGLHVQTNLRIVLASDNLKKGASHVV